MDAGLGNSVIRLGAEMNGTWETDFVGTTTVEQNLWAKCFANEVTVHATGVGRALPFCMEPQRVHGEHSLFELLPRQCLRRYRRARPL